MSDNEYCNWMLIGLILLGIMYFYNAVHMPTQEDFESQEYHSEAMDFIKTEVMNHDKREFSKGRNPANVKVTDLYSSSNGAITRKIKYLGNGTYEVINGGEIVISRDTMTNGIKGVAFDSSVQHMYKAKISSHPYRKWYGVADHNWKVDSFDIIWSRSL